MASKRKVARPKAGKASRSGKAKRVKATAAAPATAGRGRTVVFVHGIGNKPPASVLKCQWDHALFGFDLGDRSRLAYWVDRERHPEPENATCADRDLTDGEGSDGGAEVKAAGAGRKAAGIGGTAAARESLSALAREIESHAALLDERRAGAFGAQAVSAKVLPLPKFLRDLITRRITRAFLRDVNDLFFDAQRRKVMEESLLDRLVVGGGPFVVIAHSQGSMIAYLVLSRLDPAEFDVPLFVTIGSPLGLTEVKDQIKKLTGGALQVPKCVGQWINVADPLDPVALDKGLAGEYRPNARGVKVKDDLVWNPDSPRHPHSGSGYLETRAVREPVRWAVDSAAFGSVAPFTLARDLVRELEDEPETRQKVLIELGGGDAGATAGDLAERRARVIAILQRNLPKGLSREVLEIEELERYVAARLTRAEAELLAAETSLSAPVFKRVWRNAAKRALLDRSVQTVQAAPAHQSYRALGEGITWAVLDTGVVAHPHFASHANLERFYNCTVLGPLPAGGQAVEDVWDGFGHGAHVAGIIAGEYAESGATDAKRITGIAPRSKLWIYKVLDDAGEGEDAWIIKALDHIAKTNEDAGALRIHGVNLSLGGPFDQSIYGCGHSPLCEELRRLWRQGVVVVLAAGNEGFAVLQSADGDIPANMDLSIGDPANLEEAIAVGSVHKESPHTYGVSYFSSRGPTADGRQKPDCVAPGERIRSVRNDFADGAKKIDDLYVSMSGTSMAAPHVSGLIAAFLSIHSEFRGRPDDIKRILLANCTDLGRDRPMQGAGLPNLAKMLLET